MIITSIEAVKGHPQTYNIYVDSSYCFSADYDDLIELGIKENNSIDYNDLNNIISKCQYRKAYNKAIRLLSTRQRSESELRKKLRDQNFEEKIIESILAKLKELNYIDDEKFCKLWIEDRMLLKPTGKRKLNTELIEKGIDPEIINEALLNCDCDDLNIALSLIKKKAERGNLHKLDDAFYRKITRYLLYRGFGYDTVHEALKIYFNVGSKEP